MVWKIEFDRPALREFKRLDKASAARILGFLETRVAVAEDPRTLAAPMRGVLFGGCWRYRIGDHRVIADIQDKAITVLVLKIGHRREIYRERR